MAESYQIKPEEASRKVAEIQKLAKTYEEEYKGMYSDLEKSPAYSNGNIDVKALYDATKDFEGHFNDMKSMIEQFAKAIQGAVDSFVEVQNENKKLAEQTKVN